MTYAAGAGLDTSKGRAKKSFPGLRNGSTALGTTFHAGCGYLALQARENLPPPTPFLSGSMAWEGFGSCYSFDCQ